MGMPKPWPITKFLFKKNGALDCHKIDRFVVGNFQCWAVLTFLVRNFKVVSPVIKMRIEGFHIK